jgi:branched-chain amino acid transport system ATP-binding protein
MILELEEVDTFYGDSQALFQASLQVDCGEIVCLLGRNGAGKTTTLLTIMGLTPARTGNVRFAGTNITRAPVHVIARKGIGLVPSDKRIFSDLTVFQNLRLGIKPRASGDLDIWTIERIFHTFPILEDRAKQRADTLSGGEQQLLVIARALLGNPSLVLMDEPSTGLSPLAAKSLGEEIRGLREKGLAILLAEENVKFAFAYSDRCYVMDSGCIEFQGDMSDLQQNPDQMQRYLAV